jgi:hypothetical protein
VSRGHSCRKGKSRCTAKPGPHARAHKRRSLRPDGDRKANGGGSQQSDPFFMPSPPTDGRRVS